MIFLEQLKLSNLLKRPKKSLSWTIIACDSIKSYSIRINSEPLERGQNFFSNDLQFMQTG